MSNTNVSNLKLSNNIGRGASAKELKKEKKQKAKEQVLHEREQELFLFCYENEIHFDQYNKYHFRLFLNGNMLDVWPTSKKYWGRRMSASKVYKDPSELLEYLQ